MKISKILSVAAFVFAIGSAFASNLSVDPLGYIKSLDGTPVSVDCTEVKRCNMQGNVRCQSGTGVDLFILNQAETACTVEAFHKIN